MESVTSNRIYLWSKRFGAILLIAMAIVAAGNAQQFSAGKKGKVKGLIDPDSRSAGAQKRPDIIR